MLSVVQLLLFRCFSARHKLHKITLSRGEATPLLPTGYKRMQFWMNVLNVSLEAHTPLIRLSSSGLKHLHSDQESVHHSHSYQESAHALCVLIGHHLTPNQLLKRIAERAHYLPLNIVTCNLYSAVRSER